MFIAGAAGLGKTALLDVAQRSAAGKARVVRGRGLAMERDVPFGLAAQVLEPLAGTNLVEPRHDAGQARSAVLGRAKSTVEAATRQQPVMVLLDDLHWSDTDSLAVVELLAQLASNSRLALIGAWRPWPPAAEEAARQLVDSGIAGRLTLGPLSRSASDAMVDALAGAGGASARNWAWDFGRGNPYLIEHAAGVARSPSGLPSDASGELRQDAVLVAQLDGLAEPARRWAQAATVLGPEFRMALVASVAGLSPDDAGDALDTLVGSGIIRQTKRAWGAFPHALFAQAVYDGILPGSRIALHTRAFEVLADLGEPSAAARHAVAADLVADDRAVAIVEAAGRTALSAGAVHVAVELLRSGLALAGGKPPSSLHAVTGEALLAVGDPNGAADHFRRALGDRTLDPATDISLQRSLALALAYAGDLDASGRVSTAALELARLQVPEAISGVLVDRLHTVWQATGPTGARRLLDEVARSMPLPTDPTFEAARLYITYCGTGDGALLRPLAELTQTGGSGPVSPFEPRLVYACVARWEERFEDDDLVLSQAEAEARAQGVPRSLFVLSLARADNLLHRGRPLDALALLRTIEADLPIEPLVAPALAIARASALCELGQRAEALVLLEPFARAGPAQLTWHVHLVVRSVYARLQFEGGEPHDACKAYRELEDFVDAFGIGAPLLWPWASGAIRAYLAAGRLDAVERVCRWLDLRSATTSTWPAMVALAGRAGVAALQGDDAAAAEQFGRAAAIPSRLPLERAHVLLAFAGWLRRTGSIKEARPLFAEVLEVAERAGAQELARRAGAGMRAAGGRRRGPGNHPGALSAQEQRVAQLAADGLTTAEIAEHLFVSPKTVETHLSRVYAKLGVRSKRDLRGRSFGREP